MRSFGFLLSRRWAFFALAVVVVATATWWLGEWQFHRLDDRHERNAIIERNSKADPVPVSDVLAVGRPVEKTDEWLVVEATGTYDPDHTITWRYRSNDEQAGIDVVVPLVLDDGSQLLVDRGFVAAPANSTLDYEPGTPSGRVTVTGYVRADGTGDSTAVDGALGTRALSSVTAGEAIGRPTLGGWIHLRSEDPPPADYLRLAEPPELGDGPHFFYGLQWWFFGVLAIFGFLYLLWDEWRSQRRDEDADGAAPESARPATDKAARKRALKEAYRAAYEREKSDRERADR